MKKKKRGVVLLLILVILCIVGGLYFYNNRIARKTSKTKKVSDTIEPYGYTLNENHPEIYKKYFKELKGILSSDNVDEDKYLELISKMFIIDLYSLDTKIDNNDIGGVEFVYSESVENYKAKMADTLYLYLESNLYGKRKQELPIVKDVFIDDVDTVSYYYNKKTDANAYQVKVNWNYEKDLGYEKKAILYFVHDEKKLSLVEIK